jgi:hypothetical protein
MFEQFQNQYLGNFWKVGFAADPAIHILLDKSRLAQIRIRQLDQMIVQLEQQIDLARMEQSLLKEEYKVG